MNPFSREAAQAAGKDVVKELADAHLGHWSLNIVPGLGVSSTTGTYTWQLTGEHGLTLGPAPYENGKPTGYRAWVGEERNMHSTGKTPEEAVLKLAVYWQLEQVRVAERVRKCMATCTDRIAQIQ